MVQRLERHERRGRAARGRRGRAQRAKHARVRGGAAARQERERQRGLLARGRRRRRQQPRQRLRAACRPQVEPLIDGCESFLCLLTGAAPLDCQVTVWVTDGTQST